METKAAIYDAEIAAAEADDVTSCFDLGDADDFPSQRLTDEDRLTPPFDPAGLVHGPDFVIGIVPRLFQTARQ